MKSIKIITIIVLSIFSNNFYFQSIKKLAHNDVKTTTWDGNIWSNGNPNKDTKAIFASNFSTNSNLLLILLKF